MFDIRKIQEQVIFDQVKKASSDEIAQEIVYGDKNAARAEKNADWVKSTMKRMEEKFDKSEISQIRRNCQCGYGMDEKIMLVKELMKASSNIEELGALEQANAAGLFCENGKLYLQFLFCPCPMLAEVDRLETDTWCQCTTGYSKVLFEQAFECTVDVQLLASIKMGHERCLMEIIPEKKTW